MSTEPNQTTPPAAGGDGEKGSTPAHSQVPETIPYARFKDLNDANKVLQDQVKAMQDAQNAAAEAAAKEKGEFEKLYNDNLPKIKEYDELKGTLQTILQTTVESIPEDKRKLIPTEYSPQKQLDWINANRDMLITQPANKNAPVQPANAKDGKVYHKVSDVANLEYYEKNRADIQKAQSEGRIID